MRTRRSGSATDQDRQLRVVPPDGQQGDARDPRQPRRVPSSAAAWDRRVQSGQAGQGMSNGLNGLGRPRALAMFADWTDRIEARRGAAGAAASAGRRAQRRHHAVGLGRSEGVSPRRDRHRQAQPARQRERPDLRLARTERRLRLRCWIRCAIRPAGSRCPFAIRTRRLRRRRWSSNASPYWGDEPIWNSKANAHNPMLDHRGRLWLTSRVRPNENPAFCKEGSTHPSARVDAGRQFRPSARDVRPGDEEADAHRHLLRHAPPVLRRGCQPHAVDEQRRRRRSRRLAEHEDVRRDRRRSSDRRAGRRSSSTPTATAGATRYVEADQPVDPTKDRRVNAGFYGVMPSPADGSIWGSSLGFPGMLVRLNPGSNPPETDARRRSTKCRGTTRRARGAGLLAARHGRRSQRRRVGRAGQRPLRQLRSTQVHRPAQRPDRHGAALSGGLAPVPDARTALQGRDARAPTPTRTTTTGSISSTRSAWARTRRSSPATDPIRCSR